MSIKRKHPDSPIGVRLNAEQRKWVEATAKKYDRTVSWVIRSSLKYAQLRDDGTAEADAARKAGL